MVVREHDYMMGNYGLPGHARGNGANMKEPMAEMGNCSVRASSLIRARGSRPSVLHLANFIVGSVGEMA
jgi:hypothetical protein